MRGGEKVLESLCRLFPDADLFTLVYAPGRASPVIENRRITTSFLQRLPGAVNRYRFFLPLMPRAVESFDLRDYDLVLSTSHCVAKGARPRPGALHVCYCFTPMRYIWDQYAQYFGPGRASFPVRAAMGLVRPFLRRWDVRSAGTVHRFIADSAHVAGRIRRFYGREAEVIYPPVDTERFAASDRDEGHYLIVSALVPYKGVCLAVEAFNRMKLPLRVVGSGVETERLKRLAGPTITFAGWASQEDLPEEYARCRALVFPGEEDFGIVPVEAMASGKPVIALGRGGALETVVGLDHPGRRNPTGLFFPDETLESLMEAVGRFESRRGEFNPGKIRDRALDFRRDLFEERFRAFLHRALEDGPVQR